MTDKSYREKTRAVFLAFVMVTSVFGATIAFTGNAAAGNTVSPTNGVTADTGLTVFEGGEVRVDVSNGTGSSYATGNQLQTGAVPQNVSVGVNNGETVKLVPYDTVDNVLGVAETRVSTNSSGVATIDTTGVSTGDYVLTAPNVFTTNSSSFATE
ncbi:MAG: hypothetical protein J07HN6_01117, partial [Halonotius sp. J07HN6]